MKKVQELEGRVKVHVEKLRDRFLEIKGTGEVMNVMAATSALTLDVISGYSFGKSCNTLDTPDMGLWICKMLEDGFRPERFLGERGKEVLRYMVPFERGPRNCLGVNLAWSEMYLAVAAVVGGVEGLELVGTGIRDVTVDREYFIGVFPKESKGVRVKVNG